MIRFRPDRVFERNARSADALLNDTQVLRVYGVFGRYPQVELVGENLGCSMGELIARLITNAALLFFVAKLIPGMYVEACGTWN